MMAHRTWLQALAATLVVLAFLALTISTLDTTAPTFDEVAHLPAGYVALLTNDHHLNPEHPPLVKKLAALPLVAAVDFTAEIDKARQELDEWRFGRFFLFEGGRDPGRLMFLGRLPMIALGLLLCLTCFFWSRRIFGPIGGLATLIFAAFSPTILAHTRLVTTDVPVAAFGILASMLTWHYLKRPCPTRALGLGLAIGATTAAKFSGVLFIPALTTAALLARWRQPPAAFPRAPGTPKEIALVTLVAISALAVVTLSYGWPPSITPYLEGFRYIGFNHLPGYEFYLLGTFDAHRSAFYFPIAFVLKSSPGTVIFVVLVLIAFARRRGFLTSPKASSHEVAAWPFLLIPPMVYGLFILTYAPDIDIRYLIPVLPFLFVGFGMVAAVLHGSRFGRLALAATLLLHIYAGIDAYPDPISYFNGLLGCSGPEAIACLDDSNLDWGQDLSRIGPAVDKLRRPDEDIRLLYFGTSDPRAYLRHWRRMTKDELKSPLPSLYVVSLHLLNRYIHSEGVDWLHRYAPVGAVGNTYYIYDFRAVDADIR